MYNVLEKLKSGEPLCERERTIHEQGLGSVLMQLHDELDLAVLDAYGWDDLAPLLQVVNGNAAAGSNGTPATVAEAKRALDEALLERLVALNAERAAEEQRGLIRWLRPEFQHPGERRAPAQVEIEIETEEIAAVAGKAAKLAWPKELHEQVRRVADVLAAA
ncbi:MAG: class I SAM-dependent DNA methyltransferase, partial [Burkholderiales bacterium]|nr:class I SAM-dependent DNA methyltransferase [Burkholderiales bacterium]